MANLSTRAYVAGFTSVMIAGFILGPDGFAHLEIVGIGPTIGFDLPAVQDPVLELHDLNGILIAFNDDCGQAPTPPPIVPTYPTESCIEATLPAGAYTAILSGKTNDDTGVALVEIYNFE